MATNAEKNVAIDGEKIAITLAFEAKGGGKIIINRKKGLCQVSRSNALCTSC